MSITFRHAFRDDVDLLQQGLEALSADLGDDHRLDAAGLRGILFGSSPAGYGLLAENAQGTMVGIALYSPLISTSAGGAGVWVSDLWVRADQRGSGLGPQILAAIASRARARWGGPAFIRLAVYGATVRARAFYEGLGFRPLDGQTTLTLEGTDLDALKGAP